MKHNKLIPLLLLPAAVLTMTSCGEVNARPTDYEGDKGALVIDKETQKGLEVFNNIKSIIYDAKLEGGSVASKVLDEVLFELSKSIYGDYEQLSKIAGYINAGTNQTEVDNFLTAHRAFTRRGEDNKKPTDAREAKKEQIRVVKAFERIEERIAKKLFDAVSGGSYTRNGRFYETDYLMALRNTMKKVADPLLDANKAELHNHVLITPDFDETNVFEKLLHKEYYQGGEYNYISNDIVPEIYRELLVEQYLFDSSYSTLGRAYARNVNIITINNRADYPLAADNLMKAYIDSYINADTVPSGETGFELIAEAWKGVNVAEEANKDKNGTLEQKTADLLYLAGSKNVDASYDNGEKVHDFTGGTYKYWTGTSQGQLYEDLYEVQYDSKKTDIAKENEFTNNGEYTVKQGLEVKQDKVEKEDYITDGWHIRNGGLTSLDETIRTRLFNISVANALDDLDYPDRFGKDGYTNSPDGENPYVAKIHGRYYLKPETTQRFDESTKLEDMLWIDQATGSYTIVEIKEAVSSSKLALDGEDNYEGIYAVEGAADNFDGFIKMNDIAHDVAYEVAKNDSYRSLSTKYWLEKASIRYHDDTIYEYFLENYPDLFEDK